MAFFLGDRPQLGMKAANYPACLNQCLATLTHVNFCTHPGLAIVFKYVAVFCCRLSLLPTIQQRRHFHVFNSLVGEDAVQLFDQGQWQPKPGKSKGNCQTAWSIYLLRRCVDSYLGYAKVSCPSWRRSAFEGWGCTPPSYSHKCKAIMKPFWLIRSELSHATGTEDSSQMDCLLNKIYAMMTDGLWCFLL